MRPARSVATPVLLAVAGSLLYPLIAPEALLAVPQQARTYPAIVDPLVPQAWREGNQPGAYFGHSVATAGDVNGDGFDDVIVGADGYANGQSFEGGALRLPRVGTRSVHHPGLDR